MVNAIVVDECGVAWSSDGNQDGAVFIDSKTGKVFSSVDEMFDVLESELELQIGREAAWNRVLVRADGDMAVICLDRAFYLIDHPDERELVDKITSERIDFLMKRMSRARKAIYG